MIDTSPEALERLVEALLSEECETTWDLRPDCAYTLRALAAEKRAAEDGVTDAIVQRACAAYYAITKRPDSQDNVWQLPAMRAALEAVWPSGKDARPRVDFYDAKLVYESLEAICKEYESKDRIEARSAAQRIYLAAMESKK